MVNDTSIFNLRFGSNAKIHPSDEELRLFLESRKEGAKALHRDDLKPYWDLLSSLAESKVSGSAGMGEKMLFLVLGHSHFARPALNAAVAEFKYHVHKLESLDFRKPVAFIKSAEAEMGRLNPRKQDDAARLKRMSDMVEERKKTIEDLKKKWFELADELGNIISYVRDNLGRIEKLCERSISILVNEQVDRKKELDLIEDIKAEFKERLRDSLHQGTITKEHMEVAREAVTGLSSRTAELVREDIYTLTQLYERVHEHVRGVLEQLTKLAGQLAANKHAQFEADVLLYRQAETSLITLVTGIRLEVKAAEIEIVNDHDKLLIEKRRALFDHLAAVLGA
jgi:chromosome segregation ATPase